jgi:hypothetical protein
MRNFSNIYTNDVAMKVSRELQSQIFSKYLVADLLYRLERFSWSKNYSRHELIIEPWASGLWVKQAGLISYRDLAEYLKLEAEVKAYTLRVETVDKWYLVASRQDPNKNYLVKFYRGYGWKCNCMRYRCWKNRMAEELPQLFKVLKGKIFCHHIVAAHDHDVRLS